MSLSNLKKAMRESVSAEYEAGRARADHSFGRTTPERVRVYLRECAAMGCAEGRSVYDAGFMDRVRELAAREEMGTS